MPADQIDQFMRAIGTFESGNNYNAVGPYTGPRYGRARGRYQIMEKIYGGWAREAGVDPNDFSPAAQDRIARYKMDQYYKQFGSWELVAVAWFAGPGRARQAQRAGVNSLAGMSDVIGTSVPTYVKKVMGLMGSQPKTAPDWKPSNPRQADLAASGRQRENAAASRQATESAAMAAAAPEQQAPAPQPAQIEDDLTLGQIMGRISEMARKSGSAMTLDAKMMLGRTRERITTDE